MLNKPKSLQREVEKKSKESLDKVEVNKQRNENILRKHVEKCKKSNA